LREKEKKKRVTHFSAAKINLKENIVEGTWGGKKKSSYIA